MQLICKYLTIPLQSMTWMIQGCSRWGRKHASAPPKCSTGKACSSRKPPRKTAPEMQPPEIQPRKTSPVTYQSRK